MAKLAVRGGKKLIDRPIGKPWPIFDEREERALMEVLHSGKWWRGGYDDPKQSKVGQAEEAFSRYQDAKYGVAVTNGTAALECALRAGGIEPGDEVIVPAVTFVATATAPIMCGAIPVFADIRPADYNIDPDHVESLITPRTRAIIPVDYGGVPVDLDRLGEIAKRHGLLMINDCAHSHGSEWKGRKVGAIGDMGAFSFQMGKTLTCGEGGMVLTDSEELAQKLFSYHHIGRIPGRPFYEHHVAASNLRMTEWQAAVLLTQLERFDEQARIRDANARYLNAGLAEIPGVAPLTIDERVTRWCFYFFHFKFIEEEWGGVTRDQFLEALRAEGVPCHTGHTDPVYWNPLFQQHNFIEGGCKQHERRTDYTKVKCPEAERVYQHEAVCLNHQLFLGGKDDMDLILDAIRKIRENADELRN